MFAYLSLLLLLYLEQLGSHRVLFWSCSLAKAAFTHVHVSMCYIENVKGIRNGQKVKKQESLQTESLCANTLHPPKHENAG